MPRQKQSDNLADKLSALTAQFKQNFGALEKTFMSARRELQKAIDKKKLAEVKKSLSS